MQSAGNSHLLILMKYGLKVSLGKINPRAAEPDYNRDSVAVR